MCVCACLGKSCKKGDTMLHTSQGLRMSMSANKLSRMARCGLSSVRGNHPGSSWLACRFNHHFCYFSESNPPMFVQRFPVLAGNLLLQSSAHQMSEPPIVLQAFLFLPTFLNSSILLKVIHLDLHLWRSLFASVWARFRFRPCFGSFAAFRLSLKWSSVALLGWSLQSAGLWNFGKNMGFGHT
jgi:hypothetical protein